ncbi:unnamed protein product [Didymodactylos carnosus]|uniref:Uncharacterized protein n=1 Tax=Didymodactylos carnosus TaxID=1234261 RepID=A0A815K600_9BILA|nr:unnamed protein product [Didymodactylos carnosus]CAF1388994.1 unnamed protein product [Didymodactylos carnosus]CAF4142833.1 unnamed protein product [Didymodactylos carnosus]CAF4283767.1 unnamed protein product [Didymodactylos carnosus]
MRFWPRFYDVVSKCYRKTTQMNLKIRAREETTPISQIHKQELIKCSLKHNDVSFFPSYLSTDSSFYRERLKSYPKIPKSVSDLTLTGKWSTDLRDDVFIIKDLRESDTHPLITEDYPLIEHCQLYDLKAKQKTMVF